MRNSTGQNLLSGVLTIGQKLGKWQMSMPLAAVVILGVVFPAYLLGRQTAHTVLPALSPSQVAQGGEIKPVIISTSGIPVTVAETPVSVSATPGITYEKFALSDDAQILYSDTIDQGPRTRIIGAFLTRNSTHSIEPPQDTSKGSRQTIVTISSPVIDFVRSFATDLEGKGWQLSLRSLVGNQFTYIYTKEDRYIWICGDAFFTEYGGVSRHLTNKDPQLLGAITASGKVKSEVVSLVEGFRLPGKDNIFQEVKDAND